LSKQTNDDDDDMGLLEGNKEVGVDDDMGLLEGNKEVGVDDECPQKS